ncbi:hypothetical protein Hypma_010675 [Hypsizygus marmoreus]|uniref:Uncharacterized protein n=1 Tax=Hypsizygus marmoreus TaxID=39966 RepID=A0A369JNM9_HYPMA|nr:hypothetical protein Hypma_010675 [Hypsizygus marmoreus]
MLLSENPTPVSVDKADSTRMRSKGRLSRWLSHRPGLSTMSIRSKAVARRDASTSTSDLAQDAPPISGDKGYVHFTAVIYDFEGRWRCHIAQLPVEILNEIFVHCLPPAHGSDKYLSPRIEDAPMLLCHVCSHWRQVASSLVILWTSFSGRCKELNPRFRTWPNTFELVQRFLDRSKQHPISIEFGDNTLPTVRKLLFANIHRWENVSIRLDDLVAKELLGMPAGAATTLDRLSMDASYETETIIQALPAILPLFPNIRHVDFNTIHTNNSIWSNIPWSQLTHIQLRCEMPMDECAMFLGQCGQARDIQISSGGDSSEPMASAITTAMLPYLTHLGISFRDDVGDFLDHFTLPSLHYLQISTRPMTPRRNFRALEALAIRSSCVLKKFHLDDFGMLEEDLVGYLSLPCLRSVEELEIFNFNNMRDQALSLLVYPNAASEVGILPHLKSLKLEFPITSDGLFSDMIASRWGKPGCRKSPASIQHVSVAFPRGRFQQRGEVVPPHDLDILRFAEFTKQGLSIKWEWF